MVRKTKFVFLNYLKSFRGVSCICRAHTAVLQDLGGSDKSKSCCVFGNSSEKIKNWEGFPQTSQSHETLEETIDQLGEFNNLMQQMIIFIFVEL